MANVTYRRGYCTATANDYYVIVNHSKFDTPADIARAARECNYRAGNWNRSRLNKVASSDRPGARAVTLYCIDRG